mmetsp:Transcript_106076/g.295373  ORF Transcript_106076/g.295373 Transcript_106076/m.295373 type:complete len:399 (+) Transcript_106076:3-1199(+)
MDDLLHEARGADGGCGRGAVRGPEVSADPGVDSGVTQARRPLGGGCPGGKGGWAPWRCRRGLEVVGGVALPQARRDRGKAWRASLLLASGGGEAQGAGGRAGGHRAVHDLAQQGLRLDPVARLPPRRGRAAADERRHGCDEGVRALRALGEGSSAPGPGHARWRARPRRACRLRRGGGRGGRAGRRCEGRGGVGVGKVSAFQARGWSGCPRRPLRLQLVAEAEALAEVDVQPRVEALAPRHGGGHLHCRGLGAGRGEKRGPREEAMVAGPQAERCGDACGADLPCLRPLELGHPPALPRAPGNDGHRDRELAPLLRALLRPSRLGYCQRVLLEVGAGRRCRERPPRGPGHDGAQASGPALRVRLVATPPWLHDRVPLVKGSRRCAKGFAVHLSGRRGV